MKKYLLFFSVLLLTLSSCATLHTTHQDTMPPGQAKKMHGDKSARDHAPGQQKKNQPRGASMPMGMD